jgi:hypothetical protein
VGTYIIGELPKYNNALGFFFCWGRSFKIHTEIKRELFPSLYISIIQVYVDKS